MLQSVVRTLAFRGRAVLAAILLLGTASACPGQESGQLPQIAPLGPLGVPANLFPLPHRPVAGIVSEEWATEEARDRDREAEQVMNFLGVRPGMNVADLGAGSGYYTARLARRVAPTGNVFAEDVVPSYLWKLQQRVQREHLDNVVLGLGEPGDPRLPYRSTDLVLMVHMYHEVAQPYALLFNLLPALRPGARVAVIDLDQPAERHGMPRSLLLCEFHAIGFRQTHYGWIRGNLEYLSLFEPPAQPSRHEDIVPCKP